MYCSNNASRLEKETARGSVLRSAMVWTSPLAGRSASESGAMWLWMSALPRLR